MLDVARLVRTSDLGAAASVHSEAGKLASHRAAGFVAQWLVEQGGPNPDPAEIDLGTGGALTRLATLTASARARLRPDLHTETLIGRVTELSDWAAVVTEEGGRSLSVPVPAGPSTAKLRVDTLVSVEIEALSGGGTTLWVRPAFDPAADPNQRVVGGPHLLTEAERERLERPVAVAR